jgi:hypothetical protein
MGRMHLEARNRMRWAAGGLVSMPIFMDGFIENQVKEAAAMA